MYTYATTALATAALAALAQAGTLYVDNACNFPLYLQSKSQQTNPGPLETLAANTNNSYSEVMRNAQYTNNALTISLTPDLDSPLQLVYTETTQGPSPGLNYYDLSTIFGDPLRTEGFELLAAPDGYSIVCPPRPSGQDCPYTYSPSNPSGKNAVFSQNDLEDLRLRLCAY